MIANSGNTTQLVLPRPSLPLSESETGSMARPHQHSCLNLNSSKGEHFKFKSLILNSFSQNL